VGSGDNPQTLSDCCCNLQDGKWVAPQDFIQSPNGREDLSLFIAMVPADWSFDLLQQQARISLSLCRLKALLCCSKNVGVCVFLPLQIEPFGFASGSMSVCLPLQIEPFDFAAATIVSLTMQIEPFGLLRQEYLSRSPSADWTPWSAAEWFPLQLCSMSNRMVAAQKTKPWKNMGSVWTTPQQQQQKRFTISSAKWFITSVPSPQQCQNPFAGEEGSPQWTDSMAHHPYSHTTTAVV
jgi:hypothetical protein